MKITFEDRIEAGQFLANKLAHYRHRSGDVIVLGLPRGGVPVAFQVAQALRTPLDVFIVRKLGVPGQEELAMGAIAMGGVRILNQDIIRSLNISNAQIENAVRAETLELERREKLYRDNRPFPTIRGRTVILVDDGLATGASMWAAVVALRKLEPAKIVVAVPVASPQTCEMFRDQVNEIVCVITPEPFHGVGVWYKNFPQTTDEEVHDFLQMASQPMLSP